MSKITVELDTKKLLQELLEDHFHISYDGKLGWCYTGDEWLDEKAPDLAVMLRMFLLACEKEDQNAE